MGEAESYSTFGGANRQGREMAIQARLAWEKVRIVLQQHEKSMPSPSILFDMIDRLPVVTYLSGLAASLLASFLLDATKHRRAGTLIGVWLPPAFAAALCAKILRQSRRK